MLRLSEVDYDLPPELIAQTPLEERSASRLLVLHKESGAIEHRSFTDCVDMLNPGDLLVMNDARVTARRLFGQKPSGGAVEVLILKRHGINRYEALVKPARRLKQGAIIEFQPLGRAEVIEELVDGNRLLQFEALEDIELLLQTVGQVPLPPYIVQQIQDAERYQTVVASSPGSAAAPTAGLHFTQPLLAQIKAKGVELATVTLDVGIDTFRPISTDDLTQHRMHGERCLVPSETAHKISACSGRIIAVGTTAVRTLETMATGPRTVRVGETVSTLFIHPPYRFQVVDGMFTNFHMPKTSMLLMLSALCGRDPLLSAYSEAIRYKYRFLSFGDSMLVL